MNEARIEPESSSSSIYSTTEEIQHRKKYNKRVFSSLFMTQKNLSLSCIHFYR